MKNQRKPEWLGIDTSVYTSSVALLFDDDSTDFRRSVLPVRAGEKGLRQSVALFKHIKKLPELFGELNEEYDLSSLKGIGVSAFPRPILNSYMPVFEGGKSIAHIIGSILNIPVIEVSHQENHIEAVVLGTGIELDKLKDPFLAVHFSGGTSEILRARLIKHGYLVKRVAGSLDLKSGQLIDRIGVRLGMQFPAGAEMEQLALTATDKDIIIPSKNNRGDFNFSGQENYINRLLDRGEKPEEVAYAMFKMIGRTLNKSIRKLREEENFDLVIFSGGVMSNSIINEEVKKRLEKTGLELYFAPSSEYSSDNAIGNASLARRLVKKDG